MSQYRTYVSSKISVHDKCSKYKIVILYCAETFFNTVIYINSYIFFGLYLCFFVGGFRPTREFFTHVEKSPLPSPYPRYLWQLSSEDS